LRSPLFLRFLGAGLRKSSTEASAVLVDELDARGLIQDAAGLMGRRSMANTVVYTAVADKRIRNIWGK
jgi:hypothetical protein